MYYPDVKAHNWSINNTIKRGDLQGQVFRKSLTLRSQQVFPVKLMAESFDAKGKSLGTMQLSARCEGGIYFIDMKNLMGQQSMEDYKDMEMKIEGGNLEIPSSMKAGDILKNGDMKIAFSSGGMTVMNMNFSVTNRKVEAVESITTPAGTFECYKISYDIATKMMINVKSKGAEWYSKGTGMIKSETYSTDGKLLGSNVLTAIKK